MHTMAYGAVRPPVNAYVKYITGADDIDWVVVDRLVTGIPVRSTRAERVEAVTRMTRAGLSAATIAERMHCSTRTIVHARAVTA